MHNEQIEAVAQKVIERYFGDTQMLESIREALRKSNVHLTKEGESPEIPQAANLIQSLLISHTNLAEAVGKAVNAFGSLEGRIARLEKANEVLQVGLVELHDRISKLGQMG